MRIRLGASVPTRADVGHKLTAPTHHTVIDSFLERIGNDDSPQYALMSRRGPKQWQSESHALSRRLEAFCAGLAAATESEPRGGRTNAQRLR